jgi:hypothetical protein
MSRDEPRYQLNDLVWVDRGAGLWLRGHVITYPGGGLYRVGIEGLGVRSVGEREMLRATERPNSTDLERALGHAEGRLELEAVAHSTLQEQLDRERERADEERERAEEPPRCP